MPELATYVGPLYDPSTGQVRILKPGDEIPEWAYDQIPESAWVEEGEG